MRKHVQKTHRDNFHVQTSGASASQNGGLAGSRRLAGWYALVGFKGILKQGREGCLQFDVNRTGLSQRQWR